MIVCHSVVQVYARGMTQDALATDIGCKLCVVRVPLTQHTHGPQLHACITVGPQVIILITGHNVIK